MFFGWDISTSVVGFAAFDSDGKYVESRYCDLSKIEGLNQKADKICEFVNERLNEIKAGTIDTHYVEDRLAGFSGGGSNAGTIMRLAAFNAIVCWILYDGWPSSNIVMLHPSTVKASMKKLGLVIPKGADKKELTLKFVSQKEPTFPVVLNKNGNPKPYCYDMADAYITAYAGHKRSLSSGSK